MNILFRADSSSKIGHGHIRRDLVFAQEFPNDNVIFAIQELEGDITHQIPYPTILIEHNTKEELTYFIKEFPIDVIIFDHYELDYEFEKYIKEETGIKVISFDDTYQRHYCDILINHNIFADESKYKSLVPSHCELRCGGEYTLIRDEFKHAKELPKPINQTPKVLISLGGADVLNLTIPIIELLKKFDVEIVVVTTSAHIALEELQQRDDITLNVDSKKVAQVMHGCDFAIVSPSVILHEVIYLELDFIAIQTASNQEHFVEYLQKDGAKVLKEYDEQILLDMLVKEFS